jgi:hypothetical protein
LFIHYSTFKSFAYKLKGDNIVGHVTATGEKRKTYMDLVAKPERKKQIGRPRGR